MSPRRVVLASVSAAFLAACAAVSGPSAAATPSTNTQLAAAAYRALSKGDPAAAIAAYSTAIESRELEPEVLANALLNRALAYQQLNQHEAAIEDYTAALRVDAMTGKLRAMALYNRGLSHQKAQQPSRAIEDFTSALFLDSGFAHAYFSRGTVLRESGQYLFALSDYEKALQFRYPEPARVYFGEALTYEALRRPQNARDALLKSLAANPNYEPARVRLAGGDKTPKPTVATDGIATASIGSVAKKAQLPKPAAPAAALLGEDAGQPKVQVASTKRKKKTITDRVPAETAEAAAATKAPAASAEPVIEPAAAEEKVVAIESVPEIPEATATAAAQPTEEVAADAAPAGDEPAPVMKGWSVQLASASTEDAAWSTWKKMQARHRVLSDKKPVVVRADLGAKGTFYRVRLTGYDNQNDAKSVCSRLRSKGVSCFVSKTSS